LSTTAALLVVKEHFGHLESDRSAVETIPPLSPREENGEPRQLTRLLAIYVQTNIFPLGPWQVVSWQHTLGSAEFC
jgi:hypothetical protein